MRGSYEALKNVNDMKAQMASKLRICMSGQLKTPKSGFMKQANLHFAIKHIKEKKKKDPQNKWIWASEFFSEVEWP